MLLKIAHVLPNLTLTVIVMDVRTIRHEKKYQGEVNPKDIIGCQLNLTVQRVVTLQGNKSNLTF
jgi:hypothetical protein